MGVGFLGRMSAYDQSGRFPFGKRESMSRPSQPGNLRRLRAAIGFCGLLAFCWLAGTAPAIDVVIFKDGFTIQGRRFREQSQVSDAQNGMTFQLPKIKGFDMIEDGPKWIIFSSHQKQVGSAIDNAKTENVPKEFTREVRLKSALPLPFGQFNATDFNNDWKRKIDVKTGGGNYQIIEQTVAAIGPKRVVIASVTHRWYPYFDPKEMDPQLLRRLLGTHPSLDENGKPDASKRLEIATYFVEIGNLIFAERELDQAKKDIPGEWTKEQSERLDKLRDEIAKARAKFQMDELQAAVAAGRYAAARRVIEQFNANANPELLTTFTNLKAQVELTQPQFDKARRLLRQLLDATGSRTKTTPFAALLGGASIVAVPVPPLDPVTETLVRGGESVYEELHPDTASRLDTFISLASQADQRAKAGKSGGTSASELLALAISGWSMGKNGATNDVELAARQWQWRELLLDYQLEDILNLRRKISAELQKPGKPASPEVLSQLISYLPPPQPENLEQPAGTPVAATNRVVAGITKRNTGPLKESADGVDYCVRLPAEYTHGRPYRVVIAMSHHGVPPEELISQLSFEADKHGYIVAAPVWVNQFDNGYDWKGTQHYKVTSVLRDLLRHYRVDNERVFAFGFGEGANFAMDVAASHPDLFAGVVAMNTNLKYQGMFIEYWRNCQKLPVYITIGAIAGNSFDNLRRVFEHWMPQGFPAIATVYRGRSFEWFPAELPIMFDWMQPKARVRGIGALRLNSFRVEPWQTMRLTDNRFYWIGTDDIAKNNLLENNEGRSFIPAEISANILQGNTIRVLSRGVKSVIIWLERDMIDWSKPVIISINGSPPIGYRPKVMKPSIEVMLEQLYEHGDRGLLFLQKLEFPTIS